MKVWLKRAGFGVMVWAIMYAVAIPLLPLASADEAAFKAVMAGIGALVGAAFSAYYFLGVERDFLKEGFLAAVVWIVVNWLLDIVALLPFTHQTLPHYFMEIGVEYIGMFGTLLALGYVLEKKVAAK